MGNWIVRLFGFHKKRSRHNFPASAKGLGARPDQKDERDGLYARLPGLVELPKASGVEEYAGPVRNQGSLGSCVAFALIAAYELEQRKRGIEYNGSELQVYYDARKLGELFPSDVGCYPRDALKVAYNNGVAPEKLWTYDTRRVNDEPGLWARSFERWFRISSYHSIQGIEAVKQELYLGHPVIVNVPVYENFYLGTGNCIAGFEGQNLGWHEILIIGYDDDKLCFRIQNSWGTNWAEKGRAWLSYNYVTAPESSGAGFWSVRP